MATTKALLLSLLLGSLISVMLPLQCNALNDDVLQRCNFDAIYQLGDSISDTGNLIRENPSVMFSRFPYGQNFYRRATGRCSNGNLMIDYFAKSAGIPLLEPYLNREASFDHGVNFAVAGSTALPSEVLAQKGIFNPATNSSLTKQLDWMFAHLIKLCSHDMDCFGKWQSYLFMVGEIGGNDYNYALLEGKTIEEAKAMVPEAVQAIKNAITRIAEFGAPTQMIVPGNFPIGCFPIYLTSFQTKDATAYDKYHCLKDLNKFAMYHNKLLQQAIKEVGEKYPNVVVVYADYYRAFQHILHNTKRFGFDRESVQKACCGTGGDYNFNITKTCGAPGVPVCHNPDEYVSWDGVHLTERAYETMATYLLHDIFPTLRCGD